MISKSTIARIIDSARIEEVVSDFLTLKKRGVNYVALCPFHDEKTPSFNVNPSRNIFKCFGCGKGGDALTFVMEHEKMTYPEALRYLAKKYNITIEEIYNENAEEEKKLESERESLHIVCAYAQKYFSDYLFNTDEGKSIGLNYFKERGLSDAIIKKFQLGYSPENRTAFTDAAIKAGYNFDYLVKAGLTIPSTRNESDSSEHSGEFQTNPECPGYDRFSARVIFPIHSITGRVIGFGGRALRKDVKAKYINSPETEIYRKSNVLYGLFFARKAIVANDNCYLVEGYMDVLAMHQAGIENTVASSGTSLTVEQIRLIKRYTNNITIMYDGDPAGIKASFRGIDMILEEGMNVRVILFPQGDDPDSYSRKVSENELRNFIKENTTDFIRFKTQLLYSEAEDDPIKKSSLIQQIVESISLIPNSITRTVFIQECSKIMKMDEQSLFAELNKALLKRFAKRTDDLPIEEVFDPENPPAPQPIDLDLDTTEYHEKEIIRLLLNYGNKTLEIQEQTEDEEGNKQTEIHTISVAQFIHDNLSIDNINFENEIYQKIFDEYSSAILSGNVPSADYFIHYENSEIAQVAIDLSTFPYSLSDWKKAADITVTKEDDNLEVVVKYVIYSFKLRKINKMISEIQKQLHEAQSEEEIFTLISQQKIFENAKKNFAKELTWVVLR